MDRLTSSFLLLIVPAYVLAQVTLKESGPGILQPSQTLSLTCSFSGISLSASSVGVGWIRQPSGKGLEWLATIGWEDVKQYNPSLKSHYNPSLKSRLTISKDTSNNQVFLKITSVDTADTGTYYCVHSGSYYSGYGWYAMDAWGQGTSVTVSSETPRDPTIYPLRPPPSLSSDPVIIGCLIQNYFPSGNMNVTWGKSGKDISVINFPPAQISGGPYTMCSQLTLPAAECPEDTTVKCSVQYNTSPVKELSVKCPGTGCPPLSCQPSLSLQRPALEDLLLGSEASLTCTLSGLKEPKGAVFTWQPTTGKDAVQKEPVQDSCGCYSVSSVLPGCAERWNNGETFTCTATHPESETPLTREIAKVTENTFPPQVHLLPPPSEELALNELVSLTCLVRGFNPKDVLVRWLQGNEELPSESYLVFEPLREPGEGAITYLVTSVLRVSAETWKQGAQYSCMVGHEALPMSFTQKTIDRLSGKPTNVNVSVIMSEGDGICY